MPFDIRERTKKFAVRVIALIKRFPKDTASLTIAKQLIRSGTSVGANLEEADGASSRKDFLHKVAIAYKEVRESRYWLEVCLDGKILSNQTNVDEATALKNEAVELSKILYSIINPKRKEVAVDD